MRQLAVTEVHRWAGEAATAVAPLLLDVREPWEFEHCRIEGSQLMPMGNVRSEATHSTPNARPS